MLFDFSEIELARPINAPPDQSKYDNLIPYLMKDVDLKAPGVREGLNQVNMVQLGPFLSTTFDPQRRNNNAPIISLDQGVPSFLFNEPWARDRHAEMYKVCHDTKDLLHPAFQERGQFIVPVTGFTPFADLAPHTTYATL